MLALERNNTIVVELNELKREQMPHPCSEQLQEGAEEASLLPQQFLQNCFVVVEQQAEHAHVRCMLAGRSHTLHPTCIYKTVKGGVNKQKKQINLIE
jgi:hypothetical protein